MENEGLCLKTPAHAIWIVWHRKVRRNRSTHRTACGSQRMLSSRLMVNRQSIEHLYRTKPSTRRWLSLASAGYRKRFCALSYFSLSNLVAASLTRLLRQMTFRAKPLRSKAEAGPCRHYFHSSAPRLVLREKVDKLQRAM